jgi:hypothetical protein
MGTIEMGRCQHRYQLEHPPCPHDAPEGAETCVWHNTTIDKSSAYIQEVLRLAIAMSAGDLVEVDLAGLVWPRAKLDRKSVV